MPASAAPAGSKPKARRTVRWAALAVGAGLAFVAVSFYLWVGNPLHPQARVAPDTVHRVTADQIADHADAAAPATSPVPSVAAISGTARLAPALASKLAPGDALFIFARAAEGARTPLAVVRVRARDLPYEFRLDDSQALTANARVSAQGSVIVTARISKSGNAIAEPGDLQGSSKPVAPGATGLELVIDQVRQ